MTDETNIDKPKKKRIVSEETRKKMSESLKGRPSPKKGITLSEEHKRKISEKLKGRTVSEETRKKLSDANKGKIRTEETKQRISESEKGKTVSEETKKKLSESETGKTVSEETKKKLSDASKGIILSEETKKKMSDSKKGQIAWNKGIPRTEEVKRKISKKNKGRRHTEKTKKKMRESRIEYMKTTGFTCPCVGKHEIQILDKLESLSGYKIIRQYPVIGYFIDGYIPQIKLAIEVDEEHHKWQTEDDANRENAIKQELGCVFHRIKESEFIKNEIEIVNKFKQMLMVR